MPAALTNYVDLYAIVQLWVDCSKAAGPWREGHAVGSLRLGAGATGGLDGALAVYVSPSGPWSGSMRLPPRTHSITVDVCAKEGSKGDRHH